MGLRASKRDPFDDDDKEEKTPEAEPEDDAPVKELSVEPDPNEEPEGDGEEARTARRERRANRFKEAEQARLAAEERAAAAERAAAEASARVAAAEQTARMVAEQRVQPQKDPWTAALEEVQEKRKAIGLEYDALVRDGKYDQAAKDRLQAAYAKTEERAHEIVTHRTMTLRDQQAQRNPVDYEGQARTAAVAAQLQVKYPDIISNPRAAVYMNMTFMRAVQAEGKPNNWDTADAIAAETRRAFRIGTPPQADTATRARYAGMGANGGGPGGGSEGKIAMLPKYKKMAHSLFPKLTEAQAEKKWAQTVGKKILAGDG